MATLLQAKPSLLGLYEQSLTRLEPLGLTPRVFPEEFAVAQARDLTLLSGAWRVGRGLGELRIVTISGERCEIANVMLFPADPGKLPLYVAELLAFGGAPRVGFIDLQVPGLNPTSRAAVSAATRELAGCYAHLPADDRPDAWATDDSTGGYLYTRPNDWAFAADMLEAADSYLALWAELARTIAPGPVDPDAQRALTTYCERHTAESPVLPYLARTFGPAWAARFLGDFLYETP